MTASPLPPNANKLHPLDTRAVHLQVSEKRTNLPIVRIEGGITFVGRKRDAQTEEARNEKDMAFKRLQQSGPNTKLVEVEKPDINDTHSLARLSKEQIKLQFVDGKDGPHLVIENIGTRPIITGIRSGASDDGLLLEKIQVLDGKNGSGYHLTSFGNGKNEEPYGNLVLILPGDNKQVVVMEVNGHGGGSASGGYAEFSMRLSKKSLKEVYDRHVKEEPTPAAILSHENLDPNLPVEIIESLNTLRQADAYNLLRIVGSTLDSVRLDGRERTNIVESIIARIPRAQSEVINSMVRLITDRKRLDDFQIRTTFWPRATETEVRAIYHGLYDYLRELNISQPRERIIFRDITESMERSLNSRSSSSTSFKNVRAEGALTTLGKFFSPDTFGQA